MMNWHFPTTKSPESSHQRQEVTDWYASITAIIVGGILLIGLPVWSYLGTKACNINTRFSIYRKLGEWSHLSWIFYHSKSLTQISFWLLVLTPLSILGSNGDLIYLAKRLGKIPVVCLPPVLFLTIRPSPLPQVLYLALLPIHKWLSRIIILQSVLHVLIYMGYFNFKHTWNKMYKLENIWGWIAFLGFIIIAITSISSFRNKWYRCFYINHYVCSWVVVIFLQLHARPTKVTSETLISIAILVGQLMYRIYMTSTTNDISVSKLGSNLSIIEFPRSALTVPGKSIAGHIRIAKYNTNVLRRILGSPLQDYHPYTLVSLPSDRYQRLIVRNGNFKINNFKDYNICGIYDAHLRFVSKSDRDPFSISRLKISASRILIVVGGSAISFALPISRVASYHGIPIKIIWVVRDFRDVPILNFFADYIQSDDFEIFITGEPVFDEVVDIEVGDSSDEDDEDECCISSQNSETSPLLSRKSSSHTLNPGFQLPPNIPSNYVREYVDTITELNLKNRIFKGRPTLNHRYKEWCANESSFTQCSGPTIRDDEVICCRELLQPNMPGLNKSMQNCWVVSAGPRELVRNVGLWATNNGLNFHDESFTV